MIVELTIVGLIVAFIAMILSQLIYMHQRPVGYDLTDVYVGACRVLPEDADDYVAYDDKAQYTADLNVILRKLRENSNVDEVAVGSGAMPYNYNFSGEGMSTVDGDSLYYMGNMRYYTPELVRLIRLVGPNGETTEQLASALERGEFLVSPHNPSRSCDPYKLVGRTVAYRDDSTRTFRVGAVCYGIARDDYEGVIQGCVIAPFGRGVPREIVVRIKPGMGRRFMDSLNAKDLAQGNVYVTNFTSVDDMRDAAQHNVDVLTRNMVICVQFLLVAVFLGFLGSFWFRTQQRVPEIALRKVNGATQWQIFSRLISEGFLMLLIAAVIFTPIYFSVIFSGIPDVIMKFDSQTPNFIAYFVTLLILALMIVAGIWFPARKAMKVEPANALKEQ
jgi:putative ABC transport system permease protein